MSGVRKGVFGIYDMGTVGIVSYKFCRKSSYPREPPSKQRFQDFPWRLSAELPPQLRDPAQPHSSGHFALNITQRAPCWRGRHTLPQARGLYIFLWGDFYLLIIDIKLYCLLFFIKHKITQVKCEWPLLWVRECKVHDFPFSWRLREKKSHQKLFCLSCYFI